VEESRVEPLSLEVMMTVLRTFPGEQLVDRLWLRRAERPRIGVSPAFFARFGLEDPWALSQHPGDGSGWLSWLGGRGRLGLGTLGAFQRLMRRRLLAHMGAGLLHRSALGLELSPELASWWRFAGEPDALRGRERRWSALRRLCGSLRRSRWGVLHAPGMVFALPELEEEEEETSAAAPWRWRHRAKRPHEKTRHEKARQEGRGQERRTRRPARFVALSPRAALRTAPAEQAILRDPRSSASTSGLARVVARQVELPLGGTTLRRAARFAAAGAGSVVAAAPPQAHSAGVVAAAQHLLPGPPRAGLVAHSAVAWAEARADVAEVQQHSARTFQSAASAPESGGLAERLGLLRRTSGPVGARAAALPPTSLPPAVGPRLRPVLRSSPMLAFLDISEVEEQVDEQPARAVRPPRGRAAPARRRRLEAPAGEPRQERAATPPTAARQELDRGAAMRAETPADGTVRRPMRSAAAPRPPTPAAAVRDAPGRPSAESQRLPGRSAPAEGGPQGMAATEAERRLEAAPAGAAPVRSPSEAAEPGSGTTARRAGLVSPQPPGPPSQVLGAQELPRDVAPLRASARVAKLLGDNQPKAEFQRSLRQPAMGLREAPGAPPVARARERLGLTVQPWSAGEAPVPADVVGPARGQRPAAELVAQGELASIPASVAAVLRQDRVPGRRAGLTGPQDRSSLTRSAPWLQQGVRAAEARALHPTSPFHASSPMLAFLQVLEEEQDDEDHESAEQEPGGPGVGPLRREPVSSRAPRRAMGTRSPSSIVPHPVPRSLPSVSPRARVADGPAQRRERALRQERALLRATRRAPGVTEDRAQPLSPARGRPAMDQELARRRDPWLSYELLRRDDLESRKEQLADERVLPRGLPPQRISADEARPASQPGALTPAEPARTGPADQPAQRPAGHGQADSARRRRGVPAYQGRVGEILRRVALHEPQLPSAESAARLPRGFQLRASARALARLAEVEAGGSGPSRSSWRAIPQMALPQAPLEATEPQDSPARAASPFHTTARATGRVPVSASSKAPARRAGPAQARPPAHGALPQPALTRQAGLRPGEQRSGELASVHALARLVGPQLARQLVSALGDENSLDPAGAVAQALSTRAESAGFGRPSAALPTWVPRLVATQWLQVRAQLPASGMSPLPGPAMPGLQQPYPWAPLAGGTTALRPLRVVDPASTPWPWSSHAAAAGTVVSFAPAAAGSAMEPLASAAPQRPVAGPGQVAPRPPILGRVLSRLGGASLAGRPLSRAAAMGPRLATRRVVALQPGLSLTPLAETWAPSEQAAREAPGRAPAPGLPASRRSRSPMRSAVRARRSAMPSSPLRSAGLAAGGAPEVERASGAPDLPRLDAMLSEASNAEGLIKALAQARDPGQVLGLISEFAGKARSSGLSAPLSRLVERARAHEAAPEKASPEVQGSSLRAPRAAPAESAPAAASATVRQVQGHHRIMALVKRLQELIHLVDVEHRQTEARQQVRLAEDSAGARAEGTPADGEGQAADGNQDVDALVEEMVKIVNTEFENRRLRRPESPQDGSIWW